MDFTYNETQGMIRDTLARFLADTYDFDTRQKMIATDAGRDPGIWNALANELGLLGAAFDEEHGGLGGGALENALLMEEFGKVIAFAYAEPQGRYDLANIRTTAKADGSGYILNGHKGVVYCAPWATHLLVTARTGGSTRERNGVELFLIDANLPGITRRDYPTVDGNRASEVYFENVAIPGDALLAGGMDARLFEAASAVRPAHCPLPGVAAPHGRHVHGSRAGQVNDDLCHAASRQTCARAHGRRIAVQGEGFARRQICRPERDPDAWRHRHHAGTGDRPLLQARDAYRRPIWFCRLSL